MYMYIFAYISVEAQNLHVGSGQKLVGGEPGSCGQGDCHSWCFSLSCVLS